MKTAVVIGSTGLIGTLLLQKLAQDKNYGQILAICRKSSARPLASNPELNHPKIRILSFDFNNWEELEVQINSYAGRSVLNFFCCLGSTMKQAGSTEAFKKVDHDYVVSFSKLAKACRAEKLLIVSALGADLNSKIFYSRTKGEMEASVQKVFAESANTQLHFFRPSLLLGDRKDFRFGERIAILLAPLYSGLLLGPFKKYRPVSAAQVALSLLQSSLK